MMELPNHLVPWETVKILLKGAWGEGYDAGWDRGHYETEETPNPYQEDA